jgi:CheY-like chemotaxis protein
LVLIVDDRSINRKILARFAASLGPDIRVASFADPWDALRQSQAETPDLVITDFKMPQLDGAAFIRRLREQPATADVPVIVVTAYEDHEIRRQALEAGATDFILSPVDTWEFQTRARNLLVLRAQQRMLRRQALRESEERFRLLVEGVRDYAIFMLDGGGRVTSWNNGAERLLGFAEPDVIGRPIDLLDGVETVGPVDRLPDAPPDLPNVRGLNAGGLLDRARAAGSTRADGWRTRSDGSRFYADLLVTAMGGDGTGVSGYSVVIRDITEARRLEAALRRALNETQVLTRELHHRVRNTLQTISSVMHLQAMPLEAGALKRHVLRTRLRLDTLALLFRHLRVPDRITDVVLSTYLQDLQLVHLGQRPGTAIRIDPEASGLLLELDQAGPLGMLVGEILFSALDDGGAGLPLSIALERGPGQVTLEFVATGLSKADFTHNHGLGRPIIDAIAAQLGAALHVLSQEDGSRTGQVVVRLILPVSLFKEVGPGGTAIDMQIGRPAAVEIAGG